MKRALMVAAAMSALAVLAAPAAIAGEKKPITEKESVTVKATIDSIDKENRIITFKGKDGLYEMVYAGPEIKRFDELKVGDQVTFRYTAAVVYQIRKPGEPVPPSSSDEPAVVRNPTAKPSGTVTQQETATVTIKSIDMKAPSVTVVTEDGRTMMFKVEDKGRMKGVNPGDRVVITYTEALAISVQ